MLEVIITQHKGLAVVVLVVLWILAGLAVSLRAGKNAGATGDGASKWDCHDD